MHLTLSACPPFSLRAVMESHGWSQLPPFSADLQSNALTRVERLSTGQVIELKIQEAKGGVSVELHDRLSSAEREEVGQKVWWMLGLGQDLSAFHTLAREVPQLSHVENQAMGRMLRSPTVFEDMVKVILTTNTSWAGTKRMVEAILTRYGDPLPTDPSRHAFPTPAQLAAASEQDLREAGLGYRSPFIHALAQQATNGDRNLERFKSDEIPTQKMRKSLMDIKGVGEYAAASMLMLLGRYDYLPVDTWARKLVSHEWYSGEPVGQKEVESAFEEWGQWKGLAYWFWDWSLQN